MKRYIVCVFFMIFFIVQFSSCESKTNIPKGNIYKEDYLEACTLISKDYIYLETKLNKTREAFLKESKEYAEKVQWSEDKSQFVDEIRKLRSKFNDGHFDWKLDKGLYLNQKGKTLGFILTIGADDKVYVGKVYSNFTDTVSVGDEIIKWNGEDIKKEIERIGNTLQESTKYASNEIAARRIAIEYPFQPVRKELKPVTISYKNKNGVILDSTFEWKECEATVQWGNSIQNNNKQDHTILLTGAVQPSLEEIPVDVKHIHPSLLYYSRSINSKKYVVLHPRDFTHWEMQDLENTFEEILKENPDVLVVDLKDTAGGAFQQVLYLSYILNVQKKFEFLSDAIDKEAGVRSKGVDNFNNITEEIHFKNVWKGKVLFRINPLTKSGGDFFSRWMQLSDRGMIFGLPSAGAGGGTDTFTLKNTKTEISFPLRERIITGDKTIEGNSVIPNRLFDGQLIDFLKE